MKKQSTQAIILRRVNYGEADRILSVITKDQGKLSLFAKGVRRAKSKLAGGLELFCVSEVDYIDSARELKTIVSTRLKAQYTSITADVGVTMLAYDFLKLIDDHTKESCDPHFFALLENGLEALSSGIDPVLCSVWFHANLLNYAGLAINCEQQADGKAFNEDAVYSFDFELMAFAAHSSGTFAPRHIKFMRLLTRADSPAQLGQIHQATALARDLADIVERSLKHS